MMIGDMNVHLHMLGKPVNQKDKMHPEFIDEINLENLYKTLAERHATWHARNY